MTTFNELVELMAFMRGPDGCGWDREQSLDYFRKSLPEEAEEVVHAIVAGDEDNLMEELGDVLWNVLFMTRITAEEGMFTIQDVMDELEKKIIRRHPHVFGESDAKTSEEILAQWAEIKRREKKR